MNEWLYQSAWLVPTLPCFACSGSRGGLASSAQGNAQPSRVALGLPDGSLAISMVLSLFLAQGQLGESGSYRWAMDWIVSRAPALAGGLSSRSLERNDACTYHDGGSSCHGI